MRPITTISILTVLACVAAGCGSSDPTSFYLLTTLKAKAAAPSDSAPAIGIGPVTLPAYLDRPQIVTRTHGTSVMLADFHHWAEPLHENFVRVLAGNLSIQLGTHRVHTAPLGDTAVDYRVAVSVLQFEANAEGMVNLTARWTVTATKDERVLATRRFTSTGQADPTDMAAVVKVMSHTVAELSGAITQAVGGDKGAGP